MDEWIALWRAGKWDARRLEAYFAEWEKRFDLFDKERPFYQVAGMSLPKGASVWELSFESAVGANSTLFDHLTRQQAGPVLPAAAARWVLAQQGFSRSGTFTKGPGDTAPAGGTSGPIRTAAVQIIAGDSLFETLMLNLVAYDPGSERPFPAAGSRPDVPAWEKDEPPSNSSAYPTGYLDYLTWQSKRILLEAREEPSGETVVARAMIAKGHKFPDDYDHLAQAEQMVAWKQNPRARPGKPAGVPLRLSPDRMVWRDTMSLFGAVASMPGRLGTLDLVSDLVTYHGFEARRTLQLHVLGLCVPPESSKAAIVDDWRHERQPLPLRYLIDEDLVESLRICLQDAESGHAALGKALWLLAEETLAPGEDREADKDLVRRLADSYDARRHYWALLEPEFHRLVVELAELDDREEREDEWTRLVCATAEQCFDATVRGFKLDARSLRAVTAAGGRLAYQLRQLMQKTSQEVNNAHAE